MRKSKKLTRAFPDNNGGKITQKTLYECLEKLEDKIDRHHKETVDLMCQRISDTNKSVGILDEKLESHRKVDKIVVVVLGFLVIVMPIAFEYIPKVMR